MRDGKVWGCLLGVFFLGAPLHAADEVQAAEDAFMAPGLPPIYVDKTARDSGLGAAQVVRVGKDDAQNCLATDFFSVMDFGAVGDGVTPDTAAIQRAIDHCTSLGGGTVVCPAGYTFLIGTVQLKNHVTLQIDSGATLLGSDQVSEYNLKIGTCPYWPEPLEGCMIFATNAYNIALTGMGTVDGGCRSERLYVQEGAALYREDGKLSAIRPMAIRFRDCERVRIENLRFLDSRSWFTHLQFCKDVEVDGVTIDNKYQDGFNIESCEDVRISNCSLVCGDDAFAFTTSAVDRPVRNVTIANCTAKSIWSGVRLGPLSKGAFENIVFNNVVFYDCKGGGIKIDPQEGGEVRNCQFTNIRMDNVVSPICILTAPWEEIGSQENPPKLMKPSKIKNLLFANMIIDAAGACFPQPDHDATFFINGHKDALIENVVFDNLMVTFPGKGTAEHAARRDLLDAHEIPWNKYGYWHTHKHVWGVPPAYGMYVRNVDGFRVSNCSFQLAAPDARPALMVYQCADVSVDGLRAELSPEAKELAVIRESQAVWLHKLYAETDVEALMTLEACEADAVVLTSPHPFSKHRKEVTEAME